MKKFFFVLFFITHCAQPNDVLEIIEASAFSVVQSLTAVGTVGLGVATSGYLCRQWDLQRGVACGIGLYGLILINRKVVDQKRASIQEVSQENRQIAKLISDAFFAAGLVIIPSIIIECVRSKGLSVLRSL